jgi:integrase
MASWTRKRNKQVVVYYWDSKQSKQVNLPRSQTKHLDTFTDDKIDLWVENWQNSNGKPLDKINRIKLKASDDLSNLITKYQAERLEDGTSARTLQNEKIIFDKYILPYFVGLHKAKDIRKWRELGGNLRAWLTENTTLDVKTKRAVIQTVNRFGRWLADLNKIDVAWRFRTPSLKLKRRDRKSPLPRILEPKEVIAAAKTIKTLGHTNWAIALLVGYFACLRPEETFALTINDILTGTDVDKESQTLDRLREKGLGVTLALDINKALITGTTIGPPKNYYSNGIATIWHKEGGKLLAECLRDWNEDKFFDRTKDYLFHYYRKHISKYLNVTLHDLRRASGLYLGRTLGLDPFLLQDILRHGDIESTLEYTRRPKDSREVKVRKQNFDEVS